MASPAAASAFPKGSTFTIRSSDGTAVYTGEAVYDARFVFSSAAMTSGETYALTSGGTELATATAGGTGTAAVTTPDTSADTADTHQTSDSHAGLYIALGAVAVLGAAAAVVVVVLRKQKKPDLFSLPSFINRGVRFLGTGPCPVF